MKKMSIVIILLSSALTIFSHLINQIDSLFFSLPMFYPSVDLFIRFGDLMIIFGFIGLFLSTKTYPKMRLYTILFSILGLVRFLMIDFGVFESYSLMTNIALLLQMVILSLWLLEVKKVDIPLLTIKGYTLMSISFLYFLTVLVVSLLPIDSLSLTLRPTITITPFLLIAYHIGIWIYFKEWYKEAYVYKNPELMRI